MSVPLWLTCTPRDFEGGEAFFSRDSGLVCRGFQALGLRSLAVMPGESRPDDGQDLIRARRADLESAEWWAGHGASGVVLYAWGRPEFTAVARAVELAGIPLVLNQDSSGAVGPLAGWWDWTRDLAARCGGWRGALRFSAKWLHAHAAGLYLNDWRRAEHFRHGTIIAAVSPVAVERYRRLCRWYGGSNMAARVHLVPHPVEDRFSFPPGGEKQALVVAVGRWEDAMQKRPDVLAGAIRRIAEARPEVRFEIFGRPDGGLLVWHGALGSSVRDRVELRGLADRETLAEAYRRARVFLCSSSYEGAQISAQEALCSGASVVAARRPSLACYEWFVSAASGTLAEALNAESLAGACLNELEAWDRSLRNPLAISRHWSGILHAGAVARKVLELTGRLP